MYIVYSEIGLERDEKNQRLSTGIEEIKSRTQLIPCGKYPSKFVIQLITNNKEMAMKLYLEIRNED